MSDERHDQIAARLRAEAGARAPERLRADVMLRVRAEPRPRQLRPRNRRSWRPLGAVAAVACVLAALVVGLNHGAGSSPEGAFTSAGGGVAGAGTSSRLAPLLGAQTEKHASEPAAVPPLGKAQGTTTYRASAAPGAAQALEFQAERLPPGLRRALESLMLGRGRGAH